jgi:hypothetical protein
MNKKTASALLAGLAFSVLSAQTLAADQVVMDQVVMRVIVVETADVAAYVHEVTALSAMSKKAGSPITLRVWKARFAGPNTGSVVVSVEYPNLTALAKNDELTRSNADLAAEMKKIASIRKIVSDSIYEEQTP